MDPNSEYTYEEIVAKLKWLHGEEFEKYPLEDEILLHLTRNKIS